jgi:hypothetical protein
LVLESEAYPEISPDCADCQREAFGARGKR